jgi:hypothetical protein
MSSGVFGLTGGFGESMLINTVSYVHLFAGFYLIVKSSIKLIEDTKKEKPFGGGFIQWLKKKKKQNKSVKKI